jgi:HD-like signal output (HDOD) protein/CheY-like chemotaxis protein
MLRRILFVDDEQNVLDGLRNLLRKQRREWDMVFSLGAEAALAEMGKGAPFDVLVSDMRMPGMDGVALLRRVKETHPGVARIVLSGHAERNAVLASLPVAHQYLSKPCDAETLRVVIERVCKLQSLMTDDNVKRVVGKLDKLPSVPRTYWELTRAAGDPKIGIADLAKIVEQDAAMSVKVLQLVNSAYFGLAQQVASIGTAVSYLGVELLKGLALSAHVFSAMELPPIKGFSMDDLQKFSLLTAKLARRFLGDKKRAEEAFTAALVHDIGTMIIAVGFPQMFQEIAAESAATGRPVHTLEKERIGVTHADVGAYLQGVWGLPFPIVEAVAFHHNPSLVTEGACDVLAALHVADALVDTACNPRAGSNVDSDLDLSFLARTGFAAQLPRWREIGVEEFAKLN